MAWSRLQSASNSNGGGATIAQAFTTANLSSGSKIVCFVAVSSATGGTDEMTSVVLNDTAATALTQLVANNHTGNAAWSYLYAVDTPSDAVGTKPTVTATWNNTPHASFGLTILIQEVSGLLAGNTSAMLDGTPATNSGTSAGPATTGAYSSNASNEYLVAFYGDPGNGVTVSNATGSTTYTADTNNVNASGNATLFVDHGNSVGTTESASFTLSGSSTAWGTTLGAFKLGATGPVAPFFQKNQAIRARISRQVTVGRTASNAGGAVHNPPPEPTFGPLPNRPAIVVINSGWRNSGHSR